MSRPIAPNLQAFVKDYLCETDSADTAAGRELRALLAYVDHAIELHEDGIALPHPPPCKSCRLIARLRKVSGGTR